MIWKYEKNFIKYILLWIDIFKKKFVLKFGLHGFRAFLIFGAILLNQEQEPRRLNLKKKLWMLMI